MHSSYVLAAAALALPAAAAFTAPAAAGMRPVSGAGAACAVRAPANFAAGVAPAGTRRAAVLGLRASAETKSIETIKGDLMSVLSVGTGLKQAADPSNAGSVNELLLQLEPQNPTHAPAESELLNGCWELLYTGPYAQGLVDSPTREIALLVYTGGYRPGLVSSLLGKLPGPLATLVDVDDIELNIKADAPRVEASAKVTVFGNPQTLKTKGDLAASSAVRLRETVQEGDAFGQSFALPGPLNYKRDIIVTYLDDDLLVVRDETGVPDIWLRKMKDVWGDDAPAAAESAAPVASAAVVTPVNPEVDPAQADDGPGWADVPPPSDDVGPSDY